MSENNRIPATWAVRMNPDAVRKAEELSAKADNLRAGGEMILPPAERLFSALELTPPENVRCVILGQDPYPTPGVANGLAFSAAPENKIPASLRNIFHELSKDLHCTVPQCPDLSPWARRGVLLLNVCLTVRAGTPKSHAKWGWQTVTGDILRICAELPQPIVFLLWGTPARETMAQVCTGMQLTDKKTVVSTHPSPLGAYRGSETVPAFMGSRPFSRANALLESMGAQPVDWTL